jgi:rare lipoprotein A
LAQYSSGYTERGVISYFSQKYKDKTASGEKFDNTDLVGCHKKIPFNSRVRITNLNNGKSVTVRINDRGPYAYGRIMDISEAAAQKIDLIATGTAKVDIEVISDGLEETAMKEKTAPEVTEKPIIAASKEAKFITGKTYSQWGTLQAPTGYGLQMASFVNIEKAIAYCKYLRTVGFEKEKIMIYVAWENYQKAYKVMAGEYATETALEPLKKRVTERIGHEPIAKSHKKGE